MLKSTLLVLGDYRSRVLGDVLPAVDLEVDAATPYLRKTRGLLVMSTAVGHASATARSSTTTPARVAANSRRLRDSTSTPLTSDQRRRASPHAHQQCRDRREAQQPKRAASSPTQDTAHLVGAGGYL